MVKILELFSGYGTASFALKRLHIPYECIGYSDIDKYANQCFRQNHSNSSDTELGTLTWYPNELGNVKEVDPNKLEDFDLLTGGFPCQAFSVAGKGLGELDPRGTLFWEIVRIAEVKKPRYMLLENVKGLVSKKHKPTFDKILSELERIGYHVHWKVLNTKDYGIPQNRERVWFVCFKNKSEYDSFTWPEKEELKIFIKDILEPEPVNFKFYLKEHQVNKLLEALAKKNNNFQSRRFNKNIASTLAARDYKDPKIVDIQSVQWDSTGKGHHSQPDRAYDIEGVAPCLQAQGTSEKAKIFALRSYPRTGSREQDGERFQNPEFREDGCSNTLAAVEKDNLLCINPYNGKTSEIECGTIGTSTGTTTGKTSQILMISSTQEHSSVITNGVSGTLPSAMGLGGGHVPMVGNLPDGINPTVSAAYGTGGGNVPLVSPTLTTAIGRQGSSSEFMGSCESVLKSTGIFRRLTPKECFRLQGFLNDEINLDGLSDTQAYKLAGNGQSVNVVAKIFERMFKCQN